MPKLSENQLVALTGKPPRTVRKRMDKLDFKRGRGRAKLYDSSLALALILGAGDGESLIEAQRRLANARAGGQVLQNEVTRKERLPISDVAKLLDELIRNIRGIVMASRLDDEAKADILSELRGAPAKIKAAA